MANDYLIKAVLTVTKNGTSFSKANQDYAVSVAYLRDYGDIPGNAVDVTKGRIIKIIFEARAPSTVKKYYLVIEPLDWDFRPTVGSPP